MKASETNLQPVIEGTKQYVVPLFQRAYSWDIKQGEILWDDLISLSDEEQPRDHFIGSIVTMPTDSVPQGVSKFLLISEFSVNGLYSIGANHHDNWPHIRRLFFDFIYKAINYGQRMDPRSPSLHSQGMLKYMRHYLGADLPDPLY